MSLSPAELQKYQDNGYLVVENLIPGPMLQTLRQRISEIVEAASKDRNARVPGRVDVEGGDASKNRPLRKLAELAPADEFFASVARLPRILDIASELTGAKDHLLLYSDQAFLKPAFEGSEKPLHQDNSYFRITPHDAGVTCWIAVDDATEENGCMRYIPGSHKLGLLKHKSVGAPHLTPDVDFKLPDDVAVPVKAGSAIFHHLLSLHWSRANTSAKPRRAWAVHIANPAGESPVKPWADMMPLK